MKDALMLLAASAVFTASAWAFWYYLGEVALSVVSTMVIIGLYADNTRLRSRLRANGDPGRSP